MKKRGKFKKTTTLPKPSAPMYQWQDEYRPRLVDMIPTFHAFIAAQERDDTDFGPETYIH